MNRFVKFGLAYVATIFGLMLLSFLMVSLFNFDLPSGLSTVLPAMVAAMISGQGYAKQHHEAYPAALAWRHATQYTGVVIVISIVTFGIAAVIWPDLFSYLGPVPAYVLALICLFLLGLTLLIIRYFLGAGAKTIVKALK